MALVDEGRIPKNNKVAEVKAIISPTTNKMMLICLALSILLNYFLGLYFFCKKGPE